MLLECRHCGAPLDVRDGERTARCRYCGTTSAAGSLRTVAPRTPPDWRPPARWTPPVHVPADSRVTLRYHRTRSLILVLILLGAALPVAIGAVMTATASTGRRATGLVGPGGRALGPGGLAPEKLAAVTMRERAQDLAKLPGATLNGAIVRVPLSGPAWSAISFEWDPAHPDHVRQFYLSCPSAHPAYGEVRSRLEKLLPKRWNGEHFHWSGASLNFGPTSGVLHVSVDAPSERGAQGNPHWKEQVEAMWSVVQSAALGLPVQANAAAVRDHLGGGYPLTALAKVDVEADVDASAAAVKKVFPGAFPVKRGRLAYSVPLAHPWLGEAEFNWENARGARLSTVYIGPLGKGMIAEHQDQISACVGAGFGIKPRVNESDYLAKDRDYTYVPAGGGQIRIYRHLVTIELRDPPMPKASWEKALAILDACGR
ncbi:hypothetical protein WME89_21740 [Sorangium sp. So ce321]|uniref:hypothetical protein n=1 Tax=Sorangium sp. So ce321 TaxID=3133300 RepID=UPI003F5E74BE